MSCPNCFKTKSFVQATWTSISFVLGNLVLLFPGNLSLMLSAKSFLLEHYVLLAQQPWFHVCGHLKCVSIVVFPISDLEESREWQPTSPFGRHVACSLWSSDAERLLASGQDTQTQLRPIERSVREGHQKPLSDSQLWLICWGSQCATVQSQRHRKVILIFFFRKEKRLFYRIVCKEIVSFSFNATSNKNKICKTSKKVLRFLSKPLTDNEIILCYNPVFCEEIYYCIEIPRRNSALLLTNEKIS